ncbi:hypothetical protein DL96DRAFT_1779071 [Flagelloscypha sp. PMI_526]|nr:hypothetical protein DL96DRAFT_1779071 [Flagelloscypha sp. PMI_526]
MLFENLHSDLIRAILVELYKTDKSTNAILPFTLANRKLRLIALPFVYRTCRIDYATSGARLIQRWSSDPHSSLPLQYIRDIVVQHSSPERVENGTTPEGYKKYRWPTEADSTIHWELFVTFLRQLSSLCSLTWDNTSPIPITVLEVLRQRHPASHLHILDWSRRDRSATFGQDVGEQILACSPCLRTISATYSLESGGGIDYTEAALSQMVAHTPNLQSVRCLRREDGGCEVYGMTDEMLHIFKAESAKFTNSLATPFIKRTVPEILWPGLTVDLLSTWARFLDFGGILRLDLDIVDVEMFTYIASSPLPMFPSMKALSFRVPWNDRADVIDALQRFCLNLHGPSLVSLTLHQEEDCYNYLVRPLLSVEQLEVVASTCVYPRHLGIDVNRNDAQLDDSVYTFLHRLPHLQSLTLYLGFFIDEEETYPTVDEEFVLRIWEAIPSTVIELLIYVGEPDREPEIGEPIYWMYLERESKQIVTVQRNTGGGCKVDIQAPKSL